jgi:hypothetical protein
MLNKHYSAASHTIHDIMRIGVIANDAHLGGQRVYIGAAAQRAERLPFAAENQRGHFPFSPRTSPSYTSTSNTLPVKSILATAFLQRCSVVIAPPASRRVRGVDLLIGHTHRQNASATPVFSQAP